MSSMLAITSYQYGLAVIVPGLVATINLIHAHNNNTPSTEEVTR